MKQNNDTECKFVEDGNEHESLDLRCSIEMSYEISFSIKRNSVFQMPFQEQHKN